MVKGISSVLKYSKIETIAPVKLPNINPNIRRIVTSFTLQETDKINNKTSSDPAIEKSIIVH